ncbi:MAG: hypothetical protein IPH30_11510 [Betaproteobacteria bacterium]|nr:hypothetical protein [Betaproteobacteria bacterium]
MSFHEVATSVRRADAASAVLARSAPGAARRKAQARSGIASTTWVA